MYKFNLYFAGCMNEKLDKYLFERNCNRLFSQQYQKNEIQRWNSYKQGSLFNDSSLMIDSGAYSVFKTGKKMNVDDYIMYLNQHSQHFNYFIQLDDMPGEYGRPATEQEKLDSPRKSWENYLYMVEKVKEPHKLIPVFHNGEDYKWLVNMLNYRNKNNEPIPYIALAPMHNINFEGRDKFVHECFNIIKNSTNPNVKTHAIGVTRLKLLERYPFTSADSTSWIMTAANGGILTKYGTIGVSADERKTNSVMQLNDLTLSTLKEYVGSFGFTLEELSTDYVARAKFNVCYYINWMESYSYTPDTMQSYSLF